MTRAASSAAGARWPAVLAAVAGASAVLLGALGAHALRTRLPALLLDVWQTAVRFQFWHALALALAALLARDVPAARWAAWLFAFGIVLFCGSLYALALGVSRGIGVLTPIGGVVLVAAWIALGVALHRHASGGTAHGP